MDSFYYKFWKINLLQNIEMRIVGYDVCCVAGDCAINELIVIRIVRYQVKTIKWFYKFDCWSVLQCLNNIRRNYGIRTLSKNLFILFEYLV